MKITAPVIARSEETKQSPQQLTALNALREKMRLLADKKQAEILSRFFKTDPGEYGEGDIFLGIKVPVTRRLAREGQDLLFEDLESLLDVAGSGQTGSKGRGSFSPDPLPKDAPDHAPLRHRTVSGRKAASLFERSN
jgi:hypothetical protein